jgi:hypothetical protein
MTVKDLIGKAQKFSNEYGEDAEVHIEIIGDKFAARYPANVCSARLFEGIDTRTLVFGNGYPQI